ncbi:MULTISPECIES: HAMP domain-containing sensor histidine kinase [Flavobacterium]|uniref:histidine kinase n=1 Tax=Flavobacterium hankyongi TaxID=1176532 RepID=A0ABP8ZV96_9FLAO|nr:HAMP domain-containing sensor histidine kinase [Flavobacterium sp. N1846]
MTLKRRIAVNVSIAFSILYGVSAVLIYLSYSSFRRQEFMNRLEEKALTTTKLLLEVKEIDNQILKVIDRNTINKLYNEKTLIFNHNFKLIYSSIDDTSVKWNIDLLKKIKKSKRVYSRDGENDIFGIFYDYEKEDYYVLIAAEDKYGNNKLEHLLQILLVVFFAGTTLVWLMTYYFIKKLLRPLDDFQKVITTISINKLNTKLEENSSADEINLLSIAFNQLMSRIETSYIAQKEFTSNASHELRTPVSRLTLQLDNLLNQDNHSEVTFDYLKSMRNDINQISDLINSMLLLAQINSSNFTPKFKKERVDEIIFSSYEKTLKSFTDFNMNFEIISEESSLEVNGIYGLLEIVFCNLFKNAYLYSNDKKINVLIEETKSNELEIRLINSGEKLNSDEENKIFKPFLRGSNNQKIAGSGLGLRIAKRVLDIHKASLSYEYKNNSHLFTIKFPIA